MVEECERANSSRKSRTYCEKATIAPETVPIPKCSLLESRHYLLKDIADVAQTKKKPSWGTLMKTIQLTEDEHKLLVDILERASAQVLDELVHTDDRTYREALKERQVQTSALFQKVRTDQSASRILDQQEQWP